MGNEFIGDENFALHDTVDYMGWFVGFAYAATAAAIVSASVAGRCKKWSFLAYSFLFSFFIYPVINHWINSGDGWLNGNHLGQNGVIDFAGSGYVHMVGGVAALTAAKMLGPRSGSPPEHDSTLVSLGTFILWFGWYAFNVGPALAQANGAALAGKVLVATTLAAAGSGITASMMGYFLKGDWDMEMTTKGVLAGLVSISAGCATISPGLAIFVGCIGAVVYYMAVKVTTKLEIDDVMNVFPVHGACGAWGLLAAGFLSSPDNMASGLGIDNDAINSGEQFAHQLLAVAVIFGWTAGISALAFKLMERTIGLRDDGGKQLMEDDDGVQDEGNEDSMELEKPKAAAEAGDDEKEEA